MDGCPNTGQLGEDEAGVGNTTGGVQTLPSARSRATAYGGEVEGREVDTKSECGTEWRVSAVTAEEAGQGGGDWGGARRRRTSGDPARGDRAKGGGSTMRAESPGTWGLGGRAKLPQYPSTHQIN